MSIAAKEYINYWSLSEQERDGRDLLLTDLLVTNPGEAIRAMDEIIAATEDKVILSVLGAGELEDLLASPGAKSYLEDITERTRKYAGWRYAFCCMYTMSFADTRVRDECDALIALYGRS